MRKILFVLFFSFLLSLFFIFSCSKKDSPTSPTLPTTPTATATLIATQTPMTVTLNVELPASAEGSIGFFGLFSAKDHSIIQSGPVAGTMVACPSEKNFQVSFNVNPADAGTYYLLGFVDGDNSCIGVNGPCFPQEGDYFKVYGGSGVNWPVSPNVTINNDITLNLTLVNVVPNVYGTAYLPQTVSNKEYTIFASTVALGRDMEGAILITKTASASGDTVNYNLFVPIPGMHYLTFIMDVDGSGWDNPGSGPISEGDYGGIYGVPTPILNWMTPFPLAPNANLPGSGFNIYCDIFPGNTPPPTPIPTPTPGGPTGNINVYLNNIPTDQINKSVIVIVDMDLNVTNENFVAVATATVTGNSMQFNFTNIPVGSYYIYAGTRNDADSPPVAGNAVGGYGVTFPDFPSSPNASVIEGGTLNADITMVVATNNVSGRVYMPYSCPIGREWAIIIDTDLNFDNGYFIRTNGQINSSDAYFDYSLFLPLPGYYYIFALIDTTGNGFDNGPNCGDFIGIYSFPNPVYMTPVNNTNINITTTDKLLCP